MISFTAPCQWPLSPGANVARPEPYDASNAARNFNGSRHRRVEASGGIARGNAMPTQDANPKPCAGRASNAAKGSTRNGKRYTTVAGGFAGARAQPNIDGRAMIDGIDLLPEYEAPPEPEPEIEGKPRWKRPDIGKPAMERQCPQCGGIFFAWPSYVKRGNGQFCSRACYRESRQ